MFEIKKINISVSCLYLGDDGTSQEATSGVLMKESDHSYVMWCSGRIGVEGMLVQLKMVKRQDLVNFMQRIAKPATDQIVSNDFDMVMVLNCILDLLLYSESHFD